MIQRFVKTILLFLLILFTTSFCQVRDLDSAYFNKSTIELKSILDDWAERSKPLDKTIIDKLFKYKKETIPKKTKKLIELKIILY